MGRITAEALANESKYANLHASAAKLGAGEPRCRSTPQAVANDVRGVAGNRCSTKNLLLARRSFDNHTPPSELITMNKGLALVLVTSLTAACAAARMAVPADIATASEELAITDRSSWSGSLADETFNLGPYKVVEVDRKWNSKRTNTLGAVESTRASGGYSFKLSGGASQLSGACETEDRGKSADLAGGWSFGSMVAKLACSCNDASASAEIVLEASTTETYEGTFKHPAGVAHVRAINEREGGGNTHDPTGYRVDGDGVALGAVDVMGKGRVWISKTLQGRERDDLACLFAGLLLYQPPKDR